MGYFTLVFILGVFGYSSIRILDCSYLEIEDLFEIFDLGCCRLLWQLSLSVLLSGFSDLVL